METRLRRFFSKKSTRRDKDQLLKASPYEHSIAFKEPIKGTDRVNVNGSIVSEALQTGEVGRTLPRIQAEPISETLAPNIVLARREPHFKRPQTAPHRFSSSTHEGAHAAPSTTVNQNSPGKGAPSRQPFSLNISHQALRRNSNPQLDYNCGRSYTISQHTKSGKSHIDLLDAAAKINSTRTLDQRTQASGKRDYGEDVADRNIEEFGAPDLSFPQSRYLRAFHARQRYPTIGTLKIKEGKPRNALEWNLNFSNVNESDVGYGTGSGSGSWKGQNRYLSHPKSVNSRPASTRTTASRISYPIITETAFSAPKNLPNTTENIACQRSPTASVNESTPYLSPRRNSTASTQSYISSRGGTISSTYNEVEPKTKSRASSAGSTHGSRGKTVAVASQPQKELCIPGSSSVSPPEKMRLKGEEISRGQKSAPANDMALPPTYITNSGSELKTVEFYSSAVQQIHEKSPAPSSRFTVGLETIRKMGRAQGPTSPLAKVLPITLARRKSRVHTIHSNSSNESIASGVDIPISRAPQSPPSITSRIKRAFPHLASSRTEMVQPPTPITLFPYPMDYDKIEVTGYNTPASSTATARQRRVSDFSANLSFTGSFHPVSSGLSSSSESSPHTPTAGEENLLFNENGYGLGGMLPGLEEPTPMSLTASFAPPIPKGVISLESGPGTELGRTPSPNLTTTLLADIETEATIAAIRRVKGERKRARETRANAAKKLKPLSVKEESEELK